MTRGRTPAELAARHVAAFNRAVLGRDFGDFLAGFADDAVMRFENVPGAGVLAYEGRIAYAAAYAEQPPDDQIEIVGPVIQAGSETVIPFAGATPRAAQSCSLPRAAGSAG